MPLLEAFWACFRKIKCSPFLEGKKAEAEVKKACSWLRAAGFPQYVQLYDDSQFPLDIESVKRDHPFLDQDSLRALCRRLMTLNASASMKLEVRFQHKNEASQEDLCIISDHRARLGPSAPPSPGLRAASSHESVLTTLSTASLPSQASGGPLLLAPPGPACRRPGKARPGSFLRRLESLRHREKPGRASPPPESRPRGTVQVGPGGAHRVHVPGDHKPGTFPRSLSIESLCPEAGRALEDRHLPEARARRDSVGSCASLYDNVACGHQQPDEEEEEGGGDAPLDAILQHVRGLQQRVELWARAVCPELDDDDDDDEGTDSGGEAAFPPGLSPEDERSGSDAGTSASDSLTEAEDAERRDSGVGASLTRPCRKIRWHSFQNSHRPSLGSASLELSCRSCAQINLLQKYSLLRLTAFLDKFSAAPGRGWAWSVPKFMKRSKTPDYRGRSVFGVPPIVHVQRTGQPLPQSIQQAMRYLRGQCRHQVGVFRRSGVKSRIEALRRLNEASPDHVSYAGQSPYDVADLLKQYFRDLPEPLFTSKLGDSFLRIYHDVPKEHRLAAVQAAVTLLPDENREVLQTLLYFLSDMARAQGNQMTAGSLAVCLAPSVFHLNVSKKEGTSPRAIPKRGTAGKPAQRDLNDNMAATQGLSHMISDCKKLFKVPQDMMLQLCHSYAASPGPEPGGESGGPPGAGAGHPGFLLPGDGASQEDLLEASVQDLLCEAAERFKGWINVPGPRNTQLASKKVRDGAAPRRAWKASSSVRASPGAVLQRVLRERALWDEDLLRERVLAVPGPDTDLYHYVTGSMAPHPHRDFLVLRRWRSDLPRGGCLLVSTSLEPGTPVPPLPTLEGGVRALLFTSQYLMEPCGPALTRLTHICRADLRGRSPDWYNKAFGHLCATEVARIRDSFPAAQPGRPSAKP
ncbi:stAR-related lipid transfer protein 8 [Tachyglossus aculeatus]|uniref:stAR-related lipid transfer protein 8 n=1 Tax=Tachyglossus aculeatus TaxID=9261 RepID=UPI0018F3142F|nr:stAR-related lipid transfer protein 8 [Tachyglossus aculeatus]